MAQDDAFSDWIPRDYLREYYSNDVHGDELHTMRYFVEQLRNAPAGPMLCFGCGPTLHHVFATAPLVTELYLADYVPANLNEIEAWRRGDAGAHDWTPFVRYTLQCERDEPGFEPTAQEISDRMRLTRDRIAGLVPADAGLTDPLGVEFRGRFAAVLSPYCADSATGDKAVWARYSRNIASLVRPGGLMLTAALRLCQQYKVGERLFSSANIDETDLQAILEQDFLAESVKVDVREVREHENQGFSGIMLARAVKPTVG